MGIKEIIVEAYSDDLITATEAINLFSIVTESEVSKVDKDFKPKANMKLSSFQKIHITESIIEEYKSKYPDLSHVRCKDTDTYKCDGYMWMDGENLVCHVGSCQYLDDKTKWIVSLEITKNYKGHGLSKQLIDYAVKNMKCKYLSVDKSNKLAKMIYDEYGFRVYQEDKKMYYMTLDKNPVKS